MKNMSGAQCFLMGNQLQSEPLLFEFWAGESQMWPCRWVPLQVHKPPWCKVPCNHEAGGSGTLAAFFRKRENCDAVSDAYCSNNVLQDSRGHPGQSRHHGVAQGSAREICKTACSLMAGVRGDGREPDVEAFQIQEERTNAIEGETPVNLPVPWKSTTAMYAT